ncbi:MAG: protein kinase [Labilithrix sp.]|nr:protein kinase [Labilithrix sp.]
MRPGDVFAERFVIESAAGAGGMGIVYRARDRQSERPVALKVLAFNDPAHVSRFQREASVLRELSHPAIPAYIDHGVHGAGVAYLAMEWVDGETLAQLLRRGPLGVEDTLRLGYGIATALAAAHRRGVVHRDVKPANVMLGGDDLGAARVVDFGIARYGIDVTLTRPGVLIGTPGYMSPEQARGGRDVDARADVFSLGCVLFECLTGRPAFAADDILALLAKLVIEDPPPPSSLVPNVPAVVDALVRKLLAKDVEARFADASEVARGIEDILAYSAFAPVSSSPSARLLTQRELKLVSVVVASGASHDETRNEVEVESAVGAVDEEIAALAKLNVRREILADGTLLCAIVGSGLATDQVATAAQCALVLRARRAKAEIAIATGRGLMAGSIPVGEVIDRAVSKLRALERGDARAPAPSWVALDELTAGLLDTAFDLRGHGDELFLAGRRDPLGVPRTLLGRQAPFVGRDRELGFIEATGRDSFEQKVTSAALITAAPGAGKSRLVSEALARLREAHAGLGVWAARADAVGAGSPFALVGQLIRRAAGIRDDEPIDVRRKKLEARARRHVPEASSERVVSFLGEIAGTRFESDGRPELRCAREDPTLMREEIERAWIDFVAAECGARSLVVLADDLHWADLPSVKLIGAVLRKLPHAPLFVIGAGRPSLHEVFPNLWSDAELSEMRLSRLNPVASRKMVREVLGDGIDEATTDAIVSRAAGNAFYLEELIRAVSQGRGAALPETLIATMNTRLDALDPDARRVLRAASVFGDAFWRGGLDAMLRDLSKASVDHWLDVLVGQELVEVRRESRFQGDTEYAFRHALFREAAYATLIPRDLETAHHAAGVWLEAAGESDAMVQAVHFERGGEPARAVTLFRRAAEQALDGSDLDAAASRAERGIACGASGDDFAALRFVSGEVHAFRGENVEAERCGTDVLALTPPGSASWCWAASTTFALRLQLGEPAGAGTIVRELARVDPEPGAVHAYVRACAQSTALLSYAGMHDVAREMVARMDVLSVDAAPAAKGWTCFARCNVAAAEGDSAAQLRAAEEGARFFEEARSELGRAIVGIQRGAALASLGELDRASEALADARRATERLGAGHHATLAKLCQGIVATRRGDLAGARLLLEEAAAAFYDQGSPVHFGWARVVLGLALLASGDVDVAEREVSEAALVLESVPALRAACVGVLGVLLVETGRREEALPMLREAHATLLAATGMNDLDPVVALAYASALRQASLDEDAASVLEAARARLAARAELVGDAAARAAFLAHAPNALLLEA